MCIEFVSSCLAERCAAVPWVIADASTVNACVLVASNEEISHLYLLNIGNWLLCCVRVTIVSKDILDLFMCLKYK